MAVKVNYYEILGVTPDSDISAIKSAYRKLARKYHPDLNKDDAINAAKKFKMVSEAYETLSNPQKRSQYDIINGIFKTKFTSEFNSSFNNEDLHKKETPKSEKPNLKDTINEIFDEFSRNSKAKYKSKKIEPKNGTDITVDVEISLSDVAKGCKRTINVLHSETCPKCSGHKFINGAKCNSCSGKGEISDFKKITVTIPKGVKNKTKLRLKGEGNSGFNGGKNGDLYVIVNVKGNSRISYEGRDIIYRLPVAPYEAVLGADIHVPTFEGNVLLKLPPASSQGQKFRLSGLGLEKNGSCGDIIIILDIEISKTLSEDEIKLYEKLKKLDRQNLRENILYE